MSFVGDSYDAALMCTCQAQTTLATLVLHTEAAPLSLVSLGGFGSFLMCSEDKRVSVLGQSREGQPSASLHKTKGSLSTLWCVAGLVEEPTHAT